jgi:hypothetical protein
MWLNSARLMCGCAAIALSLTTLYCLLLVDAWNVVALGDCMGQYDPVSYFVRCRRPVLASLLALACAFSVLALLRFGARVRTMNPRVRYTWLSWCGVLAAIVMALAGLLVSPGLLAEALLIAAGGFLGVAATIRVVNDSIIYRERRKR